MKMEPINVYVRGFEDILGLLIPRTSDGPPVVTLCGSTRFWETFTAENLRLTLEGKIVLSVGAATSSDEQHIKEGVIIDTLHLCKIDISDSIHVLNVGGYIGRSTAREIIYAMMSNKALSFLEEEKTGCLWCLATVFASGEGRALNHNCTEEETAYHAESFKADYLDQGKVPDDIKPPITGYVGPEGGGFSR